MAGRNATAARRRAREATAAFLERRREHERQIEERAQGFFQADEALTTARAAVAEAETQRMQALAAMVDLGMSARDICDVCGVTNAEVRAARQLGPVDASDADAATDQDPHPAA